MAQRYKNIEVIAINDGSTDDTHDVLEQLAIEYPSLRVIHLAENQGKALALKRARPLRAAITWCVLMAMRYWIAMPWRIWSLR
jgi:glycosyltransferase involved in cell wall biosynthesis